MTTATTAPAPVATQPTTTTPAAAPVQALTPAATPVGLDLGQAPAPKAPAPAALPAGFNRAQLHKDLAQAGMFSADSTAALKAGGMDAVAIADLQAGYIAQATLARNEVTAKLGGEEALRTILEWAHGPQGLDQKQLSRLNDAVNSDDAEERDLAAKSLRAMYESATGEKLVAGPAPTLEGGPAPKGDPNPLKVIQTAQDYDELERDPRNRPEHPEHAAYSGFLAQRLAAYARYKNRRT